MIWSLVREQLRAQRRFVIATGMVLALAMTVASYGLFIATTANASADRLDSFTGNDKQWHVYVDSEGEGTSPAEQDEALNQAIADGSDVNAVRYFYMGAALDHEGAAVALGGPTDWSSMLVGGTPPKAGEIALSATLADSKDVGVGDSLSLDVKNCGTGCETRTLQFVVSGITRSSFSTLGLESYPPAAYVAWDDSARLLGEIARAGYEAPLDSSTSFHWNVGSPALDVLGEPQSEGFTHELAAVNFAAITSLLVVALAVGLIAMAFAVGRAQAQSRSKWVATARTLGASKGQITATTVLEGIIVGVAAAAVGVGLGYALASVQIALVHRTVPSAAFASHVIAPGWTYAALLLLALVLSAIVGIVPAFWAARVPPVAALKPVSDISEAEVSRRVSAVPLGIAWAIANGGLIAINVADAAGAGGPTSVAAIVAVIVILVTTPMLMHEALRWTIPRAGARLARSRQRARMMAGDSLLARPRQATIPGFIVSLGVGTLVATVVLASIERVSTAATLSNAEPQDGWLWPHRLPEFIPYLVVVTVLVTTLLTLAISAATATVSVREAATREALGATRAHSRWAGVIAFGVTQASGIVLGVALGLYAAAWLTSRFGAYLHTSGDRLAAYSTAVLPVLGVVAVAAIGAAIGAALSATFTPQPMTASRMEATA